MLHSHTFSTKKIQKVRSDFELNPTLQAGETWGAGGMKVSRSIQEYRVWRKSLETDGLVGFFPTMGALHEGHLDLARECKSKCAVVVSSIFVNPAQFAAHEDLGTYPRQQEEDLAKLEKAGVDMVFMPTSEMMYPEGYDTYIACDVGSGRNEGAVRPHFFRGVATVCCKLFNIVRPDCVFFGQKDAQQCVVIQHMVRDLNLDIDVCIVPTRREEDGLAMSSRNQYLTTEDRPRALVLFKALSKGKELVEGGASSGKAVCDAMKEVFTQEPSFDLQYASLLDRSTLLDVEDIQAHKEVLLSVAGKLGTTRLIDNIPVKVP